MVAEDDDTTAAPGRPRPEPGSDAEGASPPAAGTGAAASHVDEPEATRTEGPATTASGAADPDGESDAADEPKVTRPLDDADIRDALPEDLDASGYVGPYLFPNNNRRRIPGVLYLVVAALCLGLYLVRRGQEPVLVNEGLAWAALGLTAVGAYQLLSGWDLDVDERDALVVAVRTVGFPVGHASAQMGWRGLRSRPTWRILLYSAEEPPSQRGLVLVDGVDGEVVEWFVEDNPEDWSALTAR